MLFRNIANSNLGKLTPNGDYPIYNTIANKNQQADYTFSFITDGTVPLTGYIEVEFPHQFPDGLGFSTSPVCSSQKEEDTAITITCTYSKRIVKMYITDLILLGIGKFLLI